MKRTEKKRKDIVDAAVTEFQTHGFDNARLSRIAKLASVSTRTLYNHFPTKELLFDEIIEVLISETGAITSDPYNPEKPLREQLVRALSDYITATTEESYMGLGRIAMTHFLRDREVARKMIARAEMTNNPVQDIIVAAMADGKLEQMEPRFGSELLTGSARAFVYWPYFLTGDDLVENKGAIYDACVDMFLARYELQPHDQG